MWEKNGQGIDRCGGQADTDPERETQTEPTTGGVANRTDWPGRRAGPRVARGRGVGTVRRGGAGRSPGCASAGGARGPGRGLAQPRPPRPRRGRRAAGSCGADMAALVEPLGLERGKRAPGGPAHPGRGLHTQPPVPRPSQARPVRVGQRTRRGRRGGRGGRRGRAVAGCGRLLEPRPGRGAPALHPDLWRGPGAAGRPAGGGLSCVTLDSAGCPTGLPRSSPDCALGLTPPLSLLLCLSGSLRPAPAPQTCPGRLSSSSGSSAAESCLRRSCRPSSESCRAASAPLFER